MVVDAEDSLLTINFLVIQSDFADGSRIAASQSIREYTRNEPEPRRRRIVLVNTIACDQPIR